QGNAAMLELASARRPPAGVPASALDPFSLDFLRDPHPAHEALREAGPIVWLDKYGAYAAARHAEVRQILNDPATFCSSRGVGLSDFQREKPWRPPSLVLERDPPEHDRARAVLNRALSATVMRSLRARFAEAASELAEKLQRKVRFDAVSDCAEVYPMLVLPDAIGLSSQGRGDALSCAQPDQFGALRADPSKARAAFEEAIRLETPVQTFFRTTTRDVELGGATIPEGEKVLMLLGAANRDPRQWREPDRYNIDRATTGHVGFGAGVHMCVGQLLARLEGETLLAALARAFAALAPDG